MQHWMETKHGKARASTWKYGSEFACERCTRLGYFCIKFLKRNDGGTMPIVLPLAKEVRAYGATRIDLAYYRKDVKLA